MRKAIWKLGVVVLFAMGLDFGRTAILGEEELKVAHVGVKLKHIENHQAIDINQKIGYGSRVSMGEEPGIDKGVGNTIGVGSSKEKVLDEEVDQKQKDNAGCEIVRVRNGLSPYKTFINRRWNFGKGCKKSGSRKTPKESRWKLFIQKKLKAMKMSLVNLLIRFAAWLGLPLSKFAKFTFKTLSRPR
ncbi:uncharacterized protein MELLADRAFT_103371 [Melampsora larici-populina 98AG31]|uniref:Secreted protein n=1 Tax=Melampsora larici-populina (strain 98AG31 / pathotype 3-4-7) TaxID=747676 RepID=F4RB91_MELLP|nr:uncharacterized protein MELLADRAFT_103371 [Melampsora larici-populina 98AG31]EGG10041.1 secreted protein [Melampsora larici-populina 98AG31]